MIPTWAAEFANSVASNLAADLLILAGVAVASQAAIFAGRWSLRSRLAIGILGLGIITVAAQMFGLKPFAAQITFTAGSLALELYVLKDLSRVGIINSFRSTSSGVTPEKSLRLVKNSVDFLGIGAKKLTDSPEFSKMVERCRESGGKVRLLLSSPKNAALAKLAARNGRDPQSYSSRVKESIGQALHIREKLGPDVVVIKLYELGSEFALPHFRLMFIDKRICVFSHLVWNEKEGLDNPQLIIRSNRGKGDEEESLYAAYNKYFEDLWDASESSEIKKTTDGRLST